MQLRSIFPQFPATKRMIIVQLQDVDLDWEILVRSAQGIVNRVEPHIYIENKPCDKHWRKFFQEHYHLPVDAIISDSEFLTEYTSDFHGYVLTDPKIIQTTNLAATLAGLENYLPAHPKDEGMVKKLGLNRKKDFRNQFNHDVEAAEWGIENLLPACNRKMMATQCIHRDYWMARGQKLRDYLVYNQVFQIDLAANRKHLEERKLYRKILAHLETPAVQLGWYCIRDQEKEWIAEAADHGVFSLCTTGSPNLTLHGAIPPRNEPYLQPYIRPEEVHIEPDKVYITFYLTDGDAIWAMQNLQSENWLHPERGNMPFGWGFLPGLTFMAPGILEYYYHTQKSGDYFVSPSSGTGYTYSHKLPNADIYLRDSWEFMQQSGQICGNMVNWNTCDWWREVDDPEAIDREKNLLAGAPGLVCGLGGSPFAKSYPAGRCPKVHSVFVANANTENATGILNLMREIPNRPLFLFVFVQINRGSYAAVWQDFQKLNVQPDIRIVKMDYFMHGLKQATHAGLVGDSLYQITPELIQRHLTQPGREEFSSAVKILVHLNDVLTWEPVRRLHEINRCGWQELAAREAAGVGKNWEKFLKQFPAGGLVQAAEEDDAIAYFAFYTIWALIRGAILSRGIYANQRVQCLVDFQREFGETVTLAPFQKMWEIWENWETDDHRLGTIHSIVQQIAGELDRLSAKVMR